MRKLDGFRVATCALVAILVLAAGCTDNAQSQAETTRFGISGRPTADTDRYVVVFRHGGPGRSALRSAGGNVLLELPNDNAVAARIPATAVAGLRHNPNIELVELDTRRYPLAEQVTPYGMDLVQATDAVFDGLFRSDPSVPPTADDMEDGVLVCIIDSGLNAGHLDIQDWGHAETDRRGNILDDSYTVDECGHGTHVAGTIAALGNSEGVVGVLRDGVALNIIQVFEGSDCGWTYSSGLAVALDACRTGAAERGFDRFVVNMSLGGYGSSRVEERAVNRAYSAGGLLAAASGNEGDEPGYEGRYSFPASYGNVISVAAVDQNMQRASFSQFNDQLELAAPGVGVLSTVPGPPRAR